MVVSSACFYYQSPTEGLSVSTRFHIVKHLSSTLNIDISNTVDWVNLLAMKSCQPSLKFHQLIHWFLVFFKVHNKHIRGLSQDCNISIANTLQFCSPWYDSHTEVWTGILLRNKYSFQYHINLNVILNLWQDTDSIQRCQYYQYRNSHHKDKVPSNL